MPPENVRRSTRIPKEIELLLVGSDLEGKAFSEKTKTVVLSRHGAGIVSEYKLSPEQELFLRRLDNNREAEVRIVGQIGAQKGKYTYGVAFSDQTLVSFWDVEFPPLTEPEVKAMRVLLECVRCHEQETVQHSELETDVYLVNEGIVRFCNRCGSSTFWKKAAEPPPALDAPSPPFVEPVAVAASPEPVMVEVSIPTSNIAPSPNPAPSPANPASIPAPQPSVRQENRRKHVRTKVNCKACIRTFEFGDDIVDCEDMSRGGIRFRGTRSYTAGAEIEVAVPYSPGSQNIFVPAKIVHVQELKGERRFRCGVSYAAITRLR